MEEITSNAKAIELTGEETQVHFSSAFPYFWVRNDGGSTVLMSLSPNVSEGKDGVIEVPAGSSAGTEQGTNNRKQDLYILGNGKVQVMGTESPNNPFKTARKGGDSGGGTDGTILLNMPLTSDLSDISGFDRVATYTGDTPLTIDDNGIYLYNGFVKINDFLSDISDCIIEFDIKINNKGASINPQYRRILTIGYFHLGIYPYGSSTTNRFDFAMLNNISYNAVSPTIKAYADGKHHHITIYSDITNKTAAALTDDKDPIAMRYNSNINGDIILGDDYFGLNGYIKNLVIKKMEG